MYFDPSVPPHLCKVDCVSQLVDSFTSYCPCLIVCVIVRPLSTVEYTSVSEFIPL